MIEPHWKRIAGMHVEDDGTVGAVWLAHDTTKSTVYCYDAAIFRAEVKAVIIEAIAARGRRFPLAWRKQDQPFADDLQKSGVKIIPEHCTDNQAVAEVISRDIWQKLRTGQFRVDSGVGDWLKEYKEFDRQDSKVPTSGFPLMAATRHAIEMIPYAKAEENLRRKRPNFRKVATV